MAGSNNLHFAGDINVEKINIISSDGTTYSVLNQLVGIQIYEDMFSPFISGLLTFKDELDFMNGLPMIGQEVLDLVISTPQLKERGASINGQFYINEIKNREFVTERSVVYEISFISKEAITDCNIKLSKSYGGKVSDIAKNILEDKLVQFNSLKKLHIEPTKNSIKYVSNFWSPVKNMNYLCEHALSEKSSPSYLFFENRDGFNFGSLETLCEKNQIMQEFNYNSLTQKVNSTGGSNRDVEQDYKRITNFSLRDGFNLIKRLDSGMVNSLMFSSDITVKRYNVKPFSIFNTFNDRAHLNDYPLITNKIPNFYTSKIINQPRQYDNLTDGADSSNAPYLQKRISEILQGSNFRINISVPGRLDYTVGQTIRVTTFQIEPISKEQTNKEQLDMIFSGKYLISAINHYITRTNHECSLELIKDSYISSFTK